MDCLCKGFSNRTKINLVFADVTETANVLGQRHRCGRSSADVLAEALCAIGLLSANLRQRDEKISLQLKVDGPVGGCMVEASMNGHLRGYTNQKMLNGSESGDSLNRLDVLGSQGLMRVIQANTTHIISNSLVTATPPDMKSALARFYNESLQRPTAVELFVSTTDGNINRAVGLMVQRMPEGIAENFVPVLERFNDNSVHDALADITDPGQLNTLLGLDDLVQKMSRELSFGCSCSREKMSAALAALPTKDLRDMVEKGEPQSTTCHFCAETYIFTPQGLEAMMNDIRTG